jgi:hypothetical protein
VPFRYNGDAALTYPQYLNEADSTTLTAHPGGTYDMRPAGSLDLPVPPADGHWETDGAVPSGAPPQAGPAGVPPPLRTAASTEDEGN